MPAFHTGLMFAAVAAVASAAPTTDNMSAASSNILAKRAVCSYTGTINPTTVASDAPGCSSITFNGITVPKGQSLDLSKLTKGTTVTFQGHNTWLAQIGFDDSLLKIGGTDIIVTGAAGARLDGQGAQYWDGLGSNGPTPKPKFLAAHNLLGTSAINNLYLLDTPVQAVSINGCNGLKVNKMTIDNKSGNSLPANKMPHNTDGFDIGASSNIVIDGAIVDNQDDCVAINSGTGITFQNGQCNGGHGLSVGSVGHGSSTASNTVSNVQFLNNKINNSSNGIRVKSFVDGKGSIDKVTYKGITLSGITKYGILIEQNYNGGDLPKGVAPGTGVPITGLTIENIIGGNGVVASGTNVAIECANCSGWTWNTVNVTGGKKFSCVGTPSAVPAGTCA
ncbi:Endopolygalacturonase [Alternaria arborescens]|uniref:endo-polygalacturonase n=1 Tax=Alternaria arborescens TaxID=156630 RepID=A0A4Q4QDS8_9PLEO|nr:Endopolygalacturonase [Alternaria arborescens]RYO21237.1 Endopolygalacturonase [Alternaria arborescens]RYO39056.1 Endopolygalacturonase [Alternaria arborescens]